MITNRLKRKRPPTEAPLLRDYAAAFFTHDCVVSVNLASKSRPAASEIFQSMGFNLTLRQFHQATTFCPLISAMLCAVHEIIPRSCEPISRKPISQKTMPPPLERYFLWYTPKSP